jgi:hypothetical protein
MRLVGSSWVSLEINLHLRTMVRVWSNQKSRTRFRMRLLVFSGARGHELVISGTC